MRPPNLKRSIPVAVAVVAVAPATAEATSLSSTAYCSSGTTADGSQTRPGIVASNLYRLGTRLRVSRSPYGRWRVFVVRDRVGHSSQLDFYVASCARAIHWGRRTVHVRVM
jgi:3D (Asp-Asp-Asp) domain-containing protein